MTPVDRTWLSLICVFLPPPPPSPRLLLPKGSRLAARAASAFLVRPLLFALSAVFPDAAATVSAVAASGLSALLPQASSDAAGGAGAVLRTAASASAGADAWGESEEEAGDFQEDSAFTLAPSPRASSVGGTGGGWTVSSGADGTTNGAVEDAAAATAAGEMGEAAEQYTAPRRGPSVLQEADEARSSVSSSTAGGGGGGGAAAPPLKYHIDGGETPTAAHDAAGGVVGRTNGPEEPILRLRLGAASLPILRAPPGPPGAEASPAASVGATSSEEGGLSSGSSAAGNGQAEGRGGGVSRREVGRHSPGDLAAALQFLKSPPAVEGGNREEGQEGGQHKKKKKKKPEPLSPVCVLRGYESDDEVQWEHKHELRRSSRRHLHFSGGSDGGGGAAAAGAAAGGGGGGW